MSTRLPALAPVLLPLVVVVIGVAGCPIDATRDGIGTACEVDGPACPLDHTCLPDDVDDPGAGLCAPILDYGSCTPPAYAQRAPLTEDEAVVVDAAADIGKLEGVATIEGGLRLRAGDGENLLQIGDLCGFRGLQHIAGSLIVGETDVTTLDGLQGLGFVGDGVLINANPQLVDVLGLQDLIVSVAPAGRDVGVLFANNRNLDEPAIKELSDSLEAHAPGIKVSSCGNKNSPLGECQSFLDLLD